MWQETHRLTVLNTVLAYAKANVRYMHALLGITQIHRKCTAVGCACKMWVQIFSNNPAIFQYWLARDRDCANGLALANRLSHVHLTWWSGNWWVWCKMMRASLLDWTPYRFLHVVVLEIALACMLAQIFTRSEEHVDLTSWRPMMSLEQHTKTSWSWNSERSSEGRFNVLLSWYQSFHKVKRLNIAQRRSAKSYKL